MSAICLGLNVLNRDLGLIGVCRRVKLLVIGNKYGFTGHITTHGYHSPT